MVLIIPYLHQEPSLYMWQHEVKRTAELEKYSLKQAVRKISCRSASFLHDVMLTYKSQLDGSLQEVGMTYTGLRHAYV